MDFYWFYPHTRLPHFQGHSHCCPDLHYAQELENNRRLLMDSLAQSSQDSYQKVRPSEPNQSSQGRGKSFEGSTFGSQKNRGTRMMTGVNVSLTNMTLETMNRQDILKWINYCLVSNYTNIAQLSDGSAYCQLMDMLYPGTVPLKRVKFQTRFEHESIQNFKLLQAAFQKIYIDKVIPVVKLSQGRYQDNLEFCQWFRKFFVANYKGMPYDALGARGYIPLGGLEDGKKSTQSSRPSHSSSSDASDDEPVVFCPPLCLHGGCLDCLSP